MLWQLVCLICFNIWRMQVWASPVTTGVVQHFPNENAIQTDPYPVHPLLNFPKSNHYDADSVRNNSLLHHVNGRLDYHETGTKRKIPGIKTTRIRRTPTGFSARGFHDEAFDRDFGHFSPVKRRPESDASGFYGDTFSGGFGEFETMKRKYNPPSYAYKEMNRMDLQDPRYLPLTALLQAAKRRPEMTKSGFHDDVFNSDFGEFHPMRK